MSEQSADRLDVAADLAERERADALAAHARRRAREAAMAAARANADCQDCGVQIDPRRLQAVPHATRCASCESVAARLGRRHG